MTCPYLSFDLVELPVFKFLHSFLVPCVWGLVQSRDVSPAVPKHDLAPHPIKMPGSLRNRVTFRLGTVSF
jgi:hypothetical protein